MDLSQQSREQLKVVDAEYTDETEGRKRSHPTVHLFCRDENGNRRQIDVEGFRPYFYIEMQDFVDDPLDVVNDRNIVAIEADFSGWDVGDLDADTPDELADLLQEKGKCQVYHKPDTSRTLQGKQLVRIFTVEPSDVGSLREYWDQTYEADIPFPRRFLISAGIYQGIEIPEGADTVRYENWDGYSDSDGQIKEIEPVRVDIDPRMLVVDIEVATHGEGMPDATRAKKEITAITAYDNYEEEYAGWILKSDQWDDEEIDFKSRIDDDLDMDISAMEVFDQETIMMDSFMSWVNERDFDLMTGWNSNYFDYPYIVQRCWEIGMYEIKKLSPISNPGTWRSDHNDDINLKVEGRVTFDMLNAYKKTQYRELESYSLDSVANAELDYGKEPIDDTDDAWHNNPIEFMVYNVRDVQAVVEIEKSSSLIELYDNMRQVTGALYNTCNHNGPMLDTLFLREAYKQNIALTTNYEPDQGDYHGAHVFPPVPGKHDNVVYPDLASLYPYILWTLNISPETLYESKEALEADGYTTDDAFTAYVDKRDWKIIPKGEHFEPENVDQDEYKGVHDTTGNRRRKKSKHFDGIFDPQFDEIYFLKPEVKEGFIRSTVDVLVDLKYKYKGDDDMYEAVKRITNSVYGVLGDSASGGGKGFRLFDWRLAEAITLGGQKVIKFTADQYVELIDDYAEDAGYGRDTYLVGGDSVPAHEPVVIRRDGSVDIVPINDVFVGDEVWSDSGWTRVNDVIKKPNRKQMYTVQTKNGITHVTEDHGLLDADGVEQTPVETTVGDELLHEDIASIDHDEATFTEERAWLLGLFAAEGSCGIYESESGSKASWAINNTDRSVLEHAQSVLTTTFGIETVIDDVRESSNTMKLRLHETGDNASVVLGFREMLYDGTEKRVPQAILNADQDAQRAFVAGYHTGDGHIAHDHKEFDEMWTKHRLLASGVTYLFRQLGHNVTLDVRTEQKTEYYRIRSVAFHRGSPTEVRSIEPTEYSGDYVYDLETESHHFHAGIGSMIVHNTDSVMTAIPQAPDYETALDWAQRASDEVSGWMYDEFMETQFNVVQGEDEHKMDVEIESLASALYFNKDFSRDDNVATKKRYAQSEIWEDNSGWIDTPDPDEGYDDAPDDPDDLSDLKYESNLNYEIWKRVMGDEDPKEHVDIAGFEYVRSDAAEVTNDVQKQVLTDILIADNPADRIYEFLDEYVADVREGEIPAGKLGRPKGISQSLDDYGWKDLEEIRESHRYTATEKDVEWGGRYVAKPGPTYRGRKYAVDHFMWEEGDQKKSIRFYIENVRGDDYPPTYQYDDFPKKDRPDSLEVGKEVDAITVERPSRIPDEFVLDREKMINKEIRDKVQPILRTIGEDWDGMIGHGRQVGLADFM